MQAWIKSPPSWLQIQAPAHVDVTIDLESGERDAIALAQELHTDRILLDEAKARRIATALGLSVAGTLAILYEAHEQRLIDFRETMTELRRTTFYLDDSLIQSILDRIDAKPKQSLTSNKTEPTTGTPHPSGEACRASAHSGGGR